MPDDPNAPDRGDTWTDPITGDTHVQEGGSTRGHGTQAPILLDLHGDGVVINNLLDSTHFYDFDGDGLDNRTAWAVEGDGVLFYDPDNTGEITETRQFIFTEWDPTATSDLEALCSVFDKNGDGVCVYFISDTSEVFDRMSFDNVDLAKAALARNGFRRFNDARDLQCFLRAPLPPFREGRHPNGPIYSSGRFWR